jgi:hypothetical protein
MKFLSKTNQLEFFLLPGITSMGLVADHKVALLLTGLLLPLPGSALQFSAVQWTGCIRMIRFPG